MLFWDEGDFPPLCSGLLGRTERGGRMIGVWLRDLAFVEGVPGMSRL